MATTSAPSRNGRSTTKLPARVEKPSAPAKAANTAYVEHGVPRREIASSLLGRGPIPFGWVMLVLALISEQWRIGVKRSPYKLSNLEALATSKGMAAAEKIRDQGAEQLGGLVDQHTKVHTDIRSLRAEKAQLDDHPVVGVRGELLTAEVANTRMETVAAVVVKETDEGSLKHRRVPSWLRRLAPFATVLDLPILLYFIGSVFNVDWSAPGGSLIPLLTSGVFAILGTAAVALGLHYFGRELKGYKDHDGHLAHPKGRAGIGPQVYLALSITVAVGAGVVMAYRIISDSMSAGNGITGAAILGIFFAVIVVVLNVVVFSVHYRDGSTLTEEIDHHATQLRPIRAKQQELGRQIDRLTAQLTVLQVKAERIYTATLAKMGVPLKGADQVRLLARGYHQGCGAEADLVSQQGNPLSGLLLPIPSVDTSVLDDLLKRLRPTEETNDASDDDGAW